MNRKLWILLSTAILFISISGGNVFAAGQNKKQPDIERRLELIEFALTTGSPEEVANTWAKGVMSRNGALQYAVLCDNLRDEYKSGYESWDWVTGASSPWIESYEISSREKPDDRTWKYTINFHYTDSTKAAHTKTLSILVGTKIEDKPPLPVVYPGTGQKWCVIKIE